MSEFSEGRPLEAKFAYIQSKFSEKEMALFSDLKKKCLERNGEFYLDKKYFPFPDELEDFFELLLEQGVLQRLGRSENGVGGYIWRLQTQVFDAFVSFFVGEENERHQNVHEVAVDAIFENLDSDELEYILRIPEYWSVEKNFSSLDLSKNVPGDILSTRQKRVIFQALINTGVAQRTANPDVIVLSRTLYFALWSKLFQIDVHSTPEQFKGLERNEGIIFQSLSRFFETYIDRQTESVITKEYFLQFIKTQIRNKYHWNIKDDNFFVQLLENMIERGFFRIYEHSPFGEVIEVTPFAYTYLGKDVPENLAEKFEGIERQRRQEAEEIKREQLRLERQALREEFLKRSEESRRILLPAVEVPETEPDSVVVKKPRRRVVSDFEEKPKKVEKEKITTSIIEQHRSALEKMLRQEDSESVRELYGHQVPMVDDFLEYLREVVNSREQDQENKDKTYARIVSAPRTGKTTVAAEIIRRTGLKTVFFVPSINLVSQAKRDFEELLPGKKIALYSGKYLEDITDADVIVATYQKAVFNRKKNLKEGDETVVDRKLPEEFLSSALIFADEGHEATTEIRTELLAQFHSDALKIALSGTPDLNEERMLENFFPTLIHELSMREAIEMGILAPFRYSTYVVGVDASRVNIRVGQYDEAQIGVIMSELPFFKFCEALRYSNSNKNTPALLVCKTKVQAFALEKYLNQTRGENSGGIGVVVDKTDNREKILEQYEQGKINTLITVRALLRGWDSPRCKLLIDMAPGTTPVLAGQKYTRPLTKDGDSEATLYTLLPMNLPLEPILPSDILMSYELDISDVPVSSKYQAGRGGTAKAKDEHDLLPDNIDGVSIKLKVRNQEYGSFGTMKFDSHDEDLIRDVIETGIQEEETDTVQIRNKKRVEILKSYFAFRNTLFSHPQFQGYGRTFLFLCGVKGFDEYWNFIMKLFPEEAGSVFLYGDKLNRGLESGLNEQARKERPVESDTNRIIGGIEKIRNQEAIGTLIKTFFGYQEQRDFDDIFLRKKVQEVLLSLTEREQDILRRRFVEGKTLEEIGEDYSLLKERIRQIESGALRKMRKLLKTRDIEDFMDEKFNRSKKPS